MFWIFAGCYWPDTQSHKSLDRKRPWGRIRRNQTLAKPVKRHNRASRYTGGPRPRPAALLEGSARLTQARSYMARNWRAVVLRGAGNDPTPVNPVDDLLARSKGRWLVLHTRSRQEKAVARDLHAIGAGCYLPERDTVRYYGRRKAKVILPLFPGYVFLFGQRDQAYLADRLGRLVSIIEVPDQEELTDELRNLAAALRAGGDLEPCNPFAMGEWVEVGSGPFKGVRGRVEGYGSARRLILGVGLLGLGAALEIDGALLQRVDAPVAVATI